MAMAAQHNTPAPESGIEFAPECIFGGAVQLETSGRPATSRLALTTKNVELIVAKDRFLISWRHILSIQYHVGKNQQLFLIVLTQSARDVIVTTLNIADAAAEHFAPNHLQPNERYLLVRCTPEDTETNKVKTHRLRDLFSRIKALGCSRTEITILARPQADSMLQAVVQRSHALNLLRPAELALNASCVRKAIGVSASKHGHLYPPLQFANPRGNSTTAGHQNGPGTSAALNSYSATQHNSAVIASAPVLYTDSLGPTTSSQQQRTVGHKRLIPIGTIHGTFTPVVSGGSKAVSNGDVPKQQQQRVPSASAAKKPRVYPPPPVTTATGAAATTSSHSTSGRPPHSAAVTTAIRRVQLTNGQAAVKKPVVDEIELDDEEPSTSSQEQPGGGSGESAASNGDSGSTAGAVAGRPRRPHVFINAAGQAAVKPRYVRLKRPPESAPPAAAAPESNNSDAIKTEPDPDSAVKTEPESNSISTAIATESNAVVEPSESGNKDDASSNNAVKNEPATEPSPPVEEAIESESSPQPMDTTTTEQQPTDSGDRSSVIVPAPTKTEPDENDGDDEEEGEDLSDSTRLCTYEGISVHVGDVMTLEDGEFVNDIVIDFYLQYLVKELLSPEQRARVHVFNSFFYSRLSASSSPGGTSVSKAQMASLSEDWWTQLGQLCTAPPAKGQVAVRRQLAAAHFGYERVKKWTKNVDLFSKDFILIPINQDSHWFLALICYPNQLVLTERDESKTPCVVILDSLLIEQSEHYATGNLLKHYLLFEWLNKKGADTRPGQPIDKALKCLYPRALQQDNWWDCGIFLLQYAEAFLLRPPAGRIERRTFEQKAWIPADLAVVATKRLAIIQLILDKARLATGHTIKRVPVPLPDEMRAKLTEDQQAFCDADASTSTEASAATASQPEPEAANNASESEPSAAAADAPPPAPVAVGSLALLQGYGNDDGGSETGSTPPPTASNSVVVKQSSPAESSAGKQPSPPAESSGKQPSPAESSGKQPSPAESSGKQPSPGETSGTKPPTRRLTLVHCAGDS